MGNTNMVGGGGQAVGVAGTAAQGAVGIGFQNSVVGQGSVAIGSTSSAMAAGAVAFGDTAVANNARDVALGSGSATGVAVGTSGTTINGTTFAFAGTAPTSTVSVGALGTERTITNVAAGRINGSSTDAINGSQLFATNQAVSAIGQGWTVTAQGANATSVGVDSTTGNSVDLSNGDGNIVVTKSTTDNNVVFNLAPNVALNRVTAGGTVLDTSGLTIAGGPSVTTAGINAGGSTITNVAAGVNPTDAVNVSQLTSMTSGVSAAGLNFTGNDNSAGDVHRNLGETLAIRGGATTAGTYSGGNIRTITDPATGAINIQIADAPTFGGVTINAGGSGRITGVTAGTAATDAVNLSQLQAVSAVANQGWNLQANGDAATNVAPGGSVQLLNGQNIAISRSGGNVTIATSPNLTADSVSLTGGQVLSGTGLDMAGTQITGVAPGAISPSSTDAVNGSQLYATNQQVTQNTTDIASLDGRVTTVEGSLTNIAGNTSNAYTNANGVGIRYARTNEAGLTPSDAFAQGIGSTALGYDATATADSAVALGRGARATIDSSLALGAGSVADRALAPVTGTVPAGTGFVPYNTSDATLLGSVSVGDAAAGSYRQITNVADGTQAHDAVTVRQLLGAISSVTATGTKYFHANSSAGDSLAAGQESVAVGPTTIVNGDNGIGIGNGAIVDQTAPGGTAIGQNSHVSQADGIALGTNSIADGIQSIAIGAGANASFSGSVALGAGATTAVGSRTGYAAYGLGSPQNSAGEVSVGSAGAERQITNVAAGSAPTDAVNVSQLNQVAQNTASALGGGAIYDPTTGAFTAPSYTVAGNTYNNVGDALGAQGTQVTNLGNTAAAGLGGGSSYDPTTGTVTTALNVGGNTYNNVNDALTAINQTAGAGWNIQANGGPATNVPSNGTLNVTAGSNTVVSLNGNQLQIAMSASPTFSGAVNANGGLNVGGNTTVNMGGNVVQNVAAGVVSATSTDAVNGSQLYQVANSSIGYDDASHTSLTLNPGGSAVALHNVAAGVAPTDAVNVTQLNNGVESAVSRANNYTDSRLAGIQYDLTHVRRDSFAGTAGALAAAGLPQAFEPGRGMLAFGAGTYRGQSAFAIGLSRVMDDGRTVVKFGASYDTQEHAGANAGVGFQF
jgi:autotransporter adhesin